MAKSNQVVEETEKEYQRITRLHRRVKYLPTQLKTLYKKLDALEQEARDLGMDDLIRNKPKHPHDNAFQ